MTAAELREHLSREPFRPFTVRVHDGRTYDIRHPDFNLLGESVFIIGIAAPDDPEPKFADHQVWVPLKLIDSVDPLPDAPVPTVR